MCGRYFLAKAPKAIRNHMFPDDFSETKINPFLLDPRYNIAPTQTAPILRLIDGQLIGSEIRWGFRPHWMKEPGRYQINARAETVFEKPMFRQAARRQRCLVLANGWYEWRMTASGKQPHAFHLLDFAPFAIAGLWTAGRDENDRLEENFLLLTTEASPVAAQVHDRMPAVLTAEGCNTWLDPALTSAAEVAPFLRPFESSELVEHPVSRVVNNPRNEGPECIEPATVNE